MKTSSLIDLYIVWRLVTKLPLLQAELSCIPVASATFLLAFWIHFLFSTLLFNHVARIGPDRFPSQTHGEWNVFSWLFPHHFAFQYCAYFKTARNKTKTASLGYCLNTYHHLTQPFSSYICLVHEKPQTYTLLKSNPIYFWYSIIVLRYLFWMLQSSSCCCVFSPMSFWILIISSLPWIEKSSRV